MSISQLRPGDGRLAVAELAAARGSVRRVLQVPATALSVDELTDGIQGVAVLRAQLRDRHTGIPPATTDRNHTAISPTETVFETFFE